MPSDLRAHIANCLIHGETMTRRGNSVTRDTVKFTCEGREFILTQKKEIIEKPPSHFDGHFCETTEILVPNVPKAAVPAVLEVIDRLCWLLTFACQSRVVCYGHNYPDNSEFGQRRAVVGTARFFRPVIEIHDGAEIRDFVDQAYPSYARLERTRKLNVAIDYQLQAEREELPTECRLIFAFVLLENLKQTYAESEGIPFVKGFFRVGPSPKDTTITFKAMLTRMFKKVGMNINDKRLQAIVDLRNHVIHSGVSVLPQPTQRAVYDDVQDIVREYILRLLGFKGSFSVYSTACSSIAVIA